MDLTSDDVQDILKLLDELPFGEMRLQTSRFTLVLRRAPEGGWTQEMQVRSEPTVLPAAPAPGGAAGTGEAADGDAAAGEAADGDAAAGEAADGARAGEAAAGAGVGDAAGAADGAGGWLPGEGEGIVAVRAPLPGTFYRAPRPGAQPFVEVGSSVQPDTVVGIVETMKLMNSVSAGVTGTVEQIVVANAQAAEKDAVLMTIREQR